MTSGFVFNEDGSILYMVNTSYYALCDDEICFNLSCDFHNIKNKRLDNSYEIMRADVEHTNGYDVSIDFNENGLDKFRVYKVL